MASKHQHLSSGMLFISAVSLLKVRRPLHLSNNVIPLREESDPVVERVLLLLRQVPPLGADVLGLGGRFAEGTRSVLASEYFFWGGRSGNDRVSVGDSPMVQDGFICLCLFAR